MMVYSNLAEGEGLSFRYFDSSTGMLYPCEETLIFEEDMVVADAFNAFELHVNSELGVENTLTASGFSMEVWPNPFVERIQIRYTVVETSQVRIAVYDMMGKIVEILDECTMSPGSVTLEWDAANYPAGTYILKLTSEDESVMERVVLIR